MSDRLSSGKVYLAVGIGGMVGAVCRYGISIGFSSSSYFPVETLVANLIGCFLLSFLLNYSTIKARLSKEIFTGLTTGLIGAFTTFSTFAVETVELWSTSFIMAITYILVSIVGGIFFCFIGNRFGNRKQEIT